MTGPNFDILARQHTLDRLAVPGIVHALAGEGEPELVWRNELGGLTFRLGDRFLKWNPASTGIDLDRERVRLGWISTRHPAPSPSNMASMVTDSGCSPRRFPATRPWATSGGLAGPRRSGP